MLPNCYLLLITTYILGLSTHTSWASPASPSPRQLSVYAQGTLQQLESSNYQSNEISEFIFKPISNDEPSMTLKAIPTTVYRPRSLEALHHARLRSLYSGESEAVEWDQVEVLGPDIEDKHTLAQLARMAGNAYALPGQKNWYEVDMAWNTVRCVSDSRGLLLLMNWSFLSELPVWLGRSGWFSRPCISVIGQFHGRSFN
jgi:putative lipase involved disintegration of autophagic bodies